MSPATVLRTAAVDAPLYPGEGYVYFIQSTVGSIKIGWTSNIVRRFRGLQLQNPEPLELLAVERAGRDLEGDYHRRFHMHRLAGEWFSPHPDILKLVGWLQNRQPVWLRMRPSDQAHLDDLAEHCS